MWIQTEHDQNVYRLDQFDSIKVSSTPVRFGDEDKKLFYLAAYVGERKYILLSSFSEADCHLAKDAICECVNYRKPYCQLKQPK